MMEQLTVSSILRIMERSYYSMPSPHENICIEMGSKAFIYYKLACADKCGTNLALPINYLGTIIELNDSLHPSTINIYLKTK